MNDLDTVLQIVVLGLGYLERRGVAVAELEARRQQRQAEGHDGLTAEDMAEFRQRAQAAVNNIPTE